MLIEPFGKNFGEILIEICTFSIKKTRNCVNGLAMPVARVSADIVLNCFSRNYSTYGNTCKRIATVYSIDSHLNLKYNKGEMT